MNIYFRFFILDSGLLSYAKNEADIRRGRTQGRIDVGTAIISAKTEQFRIDIDDEECIHHLKVLVINLITRTVGEQLYLYEL